MKVNINPNKTLLDDNIITHIDGIGRQHGAVDLLPCLYWYEASKSLPIIEI